MAFPMHRRTFHLLFPILLSSLLPLLAATTSPESLTYSQILSDYATVSSSPTRNFNDLFTLAFVTPWNKGGRQTSLDELQRGRLDAVSIVTWIIVPDGLKGGHDFDAHFTKTISTHGGRNYPRLLFERHAWDTAAFKRLADDPQEMIDMIVDTCREHQYDGVVLEIWQAVVFSGAMQKYGVQMIDMLIALGEGLRKHDLHTILVLLPYNQPFEPHMLTIENLSRLSLGFSYLLPMTYDFSLPGNDRPGPIAPVAWVEQVAEFFSAAKVGAKTLLGLNFYGVDFLPHETNRDRHVLAHDIVRLLEEYKPRIEWIAEHGEHRFSYEGEKDGKSHVVYYPTRQSIRLRLQAGRKHGCGGVAIWDIGQGMPHFMEEF